VTLSLAGDVDVQTVLLAGVLVLVVGAHAQIPAFYRHLRVFALAFARNNTCEKVRLFAKTSLDSKRILSQNSARYTVLMHER
jgi:hypothetical protein